jgi:hypothetical protein
MKSCFSQLSIKNNLTDEAVLKKKTSVWQKKGHETVSEAVLNRYLFSLAGCRNPCSDDPYQ